MNNGVFSGKENGRISTMSQKLSARGVNMTQTPAIKTGKISNKVTLSAM